MPAVSSTTERGGRLPPREAGLTVLFLLSGVAALVYQVCWQRILSFSFGSDVESITITVSAFMLGLGLGALMGGVVADRNPANIIAVFAGFELCIGLFGLASPSLIVWVGEVFSVHSRAAGAAAAFAVLLVPTLMMGATLPMLVAHFFRIQKNVGVSTGQLYFANTFGAAMGAALAGLVAFHILDLKQVIHLAAGINILVAATGYRLLRKRV